MMQLGNIVLKVKNGFIIQGQIDVNYQQKKEEISKISCLKITPKSPSKPIFFYVHMYDFSFTEISLKTNTIYLFNVQWR